MFFFLKSVALNSIIHPLKEKTVFLTVLVEVAGKRGDKRLITVFGDAPDENKEL